MTRFHPTRRMLLALCLAAAIPAAAQEPAGATLRSAPISNIRYEVTYDRGAAAARRLRVTTTFDVDGTGPVLLSLPAWTPGAYEISNFSRWVTGFTAQASGGAQLDWDQVKLGVSRDEVLRSITIRGASTRADHAP